MYDKPLTSKTQLLQHLEGSVEVLGNQLIKQAFEAVDRANFVPEDYKVEAYEDYPLPIGYGQTISQPTTVAFMLEKLDPKPGQRILDVGAGSGWTTALLAHIVGPDGRVIGVERVPELVEQGRENIEKYNFPQATIHVANEHVGAPDKALFDRILVSAAATGSIPEQLVDQLAQGGKMVIPVDDTLVALTRHGDNGIEKESFPGFVFVPLR